MTAAREELERAVAGRERWHESSPDYPQGPEQETLMDGMVSNQSRLRRSGRTWALTATEPAWVFALKSLVHPVVAVGCLLACLAFWHQPLRGPYFLVAVLSFLGCAEVLDVIQPYRRPEHNGSLNGLVNILLRWTLVVCFIYGLLHLSKLGALYQFQVLASWALVTPVALWLGDIAARRLLTREGGNASGVRKAVIIGLNEPGLRLEERLNRDRSLRIKVTGFFEDRHVDRLPAEGINRILGRQSELPEFVRQNDINVAYVTLPMTRNPRVLELIEALRDSTVSIYFVPNLFVFELVQARFDVIGGMPVVAVCESPFFGASSIAKRLFDIAVASTLLLALSPLLLGIAVGVRLSSPGSIVFKQRRYGLDGREILIYKFRSMTVSEDGDTQYQQVTRGDGRVTPFGAWLRRLSLDELPQLFNVLSGTLSMVGPRPHAIAVNEQYRKLISGYMLRHKIKPGITGWAQVNGYRGGDNLQAMQKRVEFDMEYLKHWSLVWDLSIIVRTALVIWKDRRAF
jgi:putative colanic acid biosynthesis UDP-glucose lipid carrier transferase